MRSADEFYKKYCSIYIIKPPQGPMQRHAEMRSADTFYRIYYSIYVNPLGATRIATPQSVVGPLSVADIGPKEQEWH